MTASPIALCLGRVNHSVCLLRRTYTLRYPLGGRTSFIPDRRHLARSSVIPSRCWRLKSAEGQAGNDTYLTQLV